MSSDGSVVSRLDARARALGFSGMGLCRPQRPLFFDRFEKRLHAGCFGDMTWLANHLDIRADPTRLLEGCRTIIALTYPYSASRPSTTDGLFTARYTEPWQEDYHIRLRRLAREVAQTIVSSHPGCRIRVCVDSAPIMERSFAFLSGLGFIGKNNMLIIPGLGSYFFLAEILTDAPLPVPDGEPIRRTLRIVHELRGRLPHGCARDAHGSWMLPGAFPISRSSTKACPTLKPAAEWVGPFTAVMCARRSAPSTRDGVGR